MPWTKLVMILLLAAPVTACGTGPTGPATIKGECKLFRPPVAALRGADRYTEDYLDDTVEAGVAGCGWKRIGAKG